MSPLNDHPVGYNPFESSGFAAADGGFTGRIIDAEAGIGIFTANSDPDNVGIDPITGDEAPVGTDTGVAAYFRRFILSGVENGDFAAPPPDVDSQISANNKLPGYRMTKSQGSAVTAYSIADSSLSSGHMIRFDISEGLDGDEAYLEQLVKVIGSPSQRWTVPPVATWKGAVTSNSMVAFVASQPLTVNLSETGSEFETATTFETIAPLASGMMVYAHELTENPTLPADAYYLRVRAGVRRGAEASNSSGSIYLAELSANSFNDRAYLTDESDPTSGPITLVSSGGTLRFIVNGGTFAGAIGPEGGFTFPPVQIPSSNVWALDDYEEGDGGWTPAITFVTPGDLTVAYSVQSGSYTKIGNRVLWDCLITTSSFSHTTASGELKITGLPFAVGNYSIGACLMQGHAGTARSWNVAIPIPGTTYMGVNASVDTAAQTAVTAAMMPTGGTVLIWASGHYRV